MNNNSQSYEIPYHRQVFVNRTLNLSAISIAGFDMDYTLALYRSEVESLAWELTLKKLVERLKYDAEILSFKYDPAFPLRGLIIDTFLGNILKVDCHRYVWRAMHGLKTLSKEESDELYGSEPIEPSKKRFFLVDTLFSLPEVYLFALLVDFYEGRGLKPDRHEYYRFYKDIRETMDEIHADNSLKSIIAADFERYIIKDPDIPKTLHKLRSGGKKLFLLTNSLYDYTDKVMNFLFSGFMPEYPAWRNFFDAIIVGARKPHFFTGRDSFIELNSRGEQTGNKVERFEKGRIYQGGNQKEFERISGFRGDEILYVGDNIYGDIMKSKKVSVWRSVMIIQEMEGELEKLHSLRGEIRRMRELEMLYLGYQMQIRARLAEMKAIVGADAGTPERRERVEEEIENFKNSIKYTGQALREIDEEISKKFNPHFGMLFKEGWEHSIFGAQVEEYACLYTGRVGNMMLYSNLEYFRSLRDSLPHELVLNY
ncbi:MAG: HAD-IG family 5'-nucleotidase [Deltaproteobacteria bacterium]|nr:HAD-IG family 5'-nucleotidase [Deltaproteobacteria bacterium]